MPNGGDAMDIDGVNSTTTSTATTAQLNNTIHKSILSSKEKLKSKSYVIQLYK